jgi:hypothetical protein
VLREFLPKVALARDANRYSLALMALSTKLHDSSAGIQLSEALLPPAGTCEVPIEVRVAEGMYVIASDSAYDLKGTGFEVGDVITKLDGLPVSTLTNGWKLYYPESNEASLLTDLAHYLTRGRCGRAELGIRRGFQDLVVRTERVPLPTKRYPHDLPGPSFRLLSPDVAYLKLSTANGSYATRYVSEAAHAKGWIIDAREWGDQWSFQSTLGPLLVDRQIPFARFTRADLSNPGAFYWTQPVQLTPRQPHYEGKVAILVDEMTSADGEYAALAFRTAPGAIVVGSTTSGAAAMFDALADLRLPGGVAAFMSGIGVFYPDKRPTQRIGIKIDVPAKPTIAGIRAGRDEVLEVGLRQIVGADKAAALIDSLSNVKIADASPETKQ